MMSRRKKIDTRIPQQAYSLTRICWSWRMHRIEILIERGKPLCAKSAVCGDIATRSPSKIHSLRYFVFEESIGLKFLSKDVSQCVGNLPYVETLQHDYRKFRLSVPHIPCDITITKIVIFKGISNFSWNITIESNPIFLIFLCP